MQLEQMKRAGREVVFRAASQPWQVEKLARSTVEDRFSWSTHYSSQVQLLSRHVRSPARPTTHKEVHEVILRSVKL